MKTCGNCSQSKPESEYGTDTVQRDDLTNWCFPCLGKPVVVPSEKTEGDTETNQPAATRKTTRAKTPRTPKVTESNE